MSKNPTILEKIYAQRAQDIEIVKQTPGMTPEDISRLLSMHLAPPLIPFVDRLKRNPSNATSGPDDIPSPSLMAEIKRASPSKGPIALTIPVAKQALTYALAGASVISVLTEPHWFKGSLQDMLMVRQSISSLPDRPAVLRKEFILDEYQIAEARLYGADTVLLIVAMMNDELLTRLYQYSRSLGMEPLVEVNNADEMRRALSINARVIGVNNRNLHDFNVDMGTTSRLVDMVKDRDVILCALSGISTPQDVRMYKEQGVKAILVGESLMRAKDTATFIRELLDWPDLRHPKPVLSPIVKAFGVTTQDQARKLVDIGVSILGLIFDPTLENSVTLDQATTIRNVFPKSATGTTVVPSRPVNTPWFHSHLSTILVQCTNHRPLLVGHFTTHPSHTLSFILETIAAASLDLVQFDGALPADWSRFIPVPVIRRFASPVSPNDQQTSNDSTMRDASPTTTAIIQGINDAGQITRPGLHTFSLVDLTVASGSSNVYVPFNNQPGTANTVNHDLISATAFKLAARDQSNTLSSSLLTTAIEETKKLIIAKELCGKWSTPVLVTTGKEKITPDVVKDIGAWGVEVGANESDLEGYIKSLRSITTE